MKTIITEQTKKNLCDSIVATIDQEYTKAIKAIIAEMKKPEEKRSNAKIKHSLQTMGDWEYSIEHNESLVILTEGINHSAFKAHLIEKAKSMFAEAGVL